MTVSVRILLLIAALPLSSFFYFSPAKETKASSNERELVSFEAISDGKKVIVSWTSFSETSFDYYTIEKSKDGIHFYPALMIKSAGKLTNLFEYTDIDYSPFSGISFYRLRQNDYFGGFNYSPIITVNCHLQKDGTLVPYSDDKTTPIDLGNMEGQAMLVVVRDNKGEEFVSKIMVKDQDNKLYASDTKHQLIAGDYFVIASSCNSLYHQKLIVK